MKPNDDILACIVPQPKIDPPELDLQLVRQKAEARKLRRELFWVAIGGWLMTLAMLLGLMLVIRLEPVIPGGKWLFILAGGGFILLAGSAASALVLYSKHKERSV